jgi:Voltage-dependent anion channel
LHRITQWPDALQFTGAWRSLVFPLGMYSVATGAMAAEVGVRSMQTVSLVFFWDAFAAWLIVAVRVAAFAAHPYRSAGVAGAFRALTATPADRNSRAASPRIAQ